MAAKPDSIEAWLEQLGQPSADRDYRPGHARMHVLLAAMPSCRPRLRIRVAGTNGKGSTAFMVAQALTALGLKVGLYTSPHILEFNERIRIDGMPVSEGAILAALERLMPVALRVGASYFEVATAAALLIFADAAVDAEVLEAGVGARLDATTSVPADMALLTPIGLDHQAWLGDSLIQIAGEKACVMQGCRWSLSAPQDSAVADVLRQTDQGLEVVGVEYWPELAMPGRHQQVNAALAMAAIRRLLQERAIAGDVDVARQAIARTCVPGRLQRLTHGRATIWLDAAHNMHGVEALLPSLKGLADPFDAILVFTREDRDLSAAAALLRPYAKRLIGNRGDGFDRLASDSVSTLREELTRQPQGRFLVLGSFVTLAAVLRSLGLSRLA